MTREEQAQHDVLEFLHRLEGAALDRAGAKLRLLRWRQETDACYRTRLFLVLEERANQERREG